MKVLPVKLPDEMYTKLKKLAKSQGTTMAAIIRKNLPRPKTTPHQPRKKLTFLEFAEKHQYKGKIYHADKTDDEILYGGKLGDY